MEEAMRVAIQHGTPVCWGIEARFKKAPISNLPSGWQSVKRRLRAGKPAMAYVRVNDEVQAWVLGPDDKDHKLIKLAILQGVNTKKSSVCEWWPA